MTENEASKERGMLVNSVRKLCAGALSAPTSPFINIREGLTPEGDKLPKRFYREALPETRKIITEEQMDQLLKDYYKVRGRDEKGVPRDISS